MGRAVLERFGAYYLLDRIAEGGMAEVFRARFARTDANGRIVVIKRILPIIANDKKFAEMFRTESHICMGFNHPNTIQIFDFDNGGPVPFIAMEYVEGRSVADIMKRNKAMNHPLPIPVAIGITFLASGGLEYAHGFQNRATGECLHLIHQDISPQNILVSYEGSVKIIDFGVAKIVVENTDKVPPGVLQGKASYFSPEQAMGLPLDARSDIFSLGIVLWELLTGHRLFFRSGLETRELLHVVRHCDSIVVPPSRYNLAVPKQLDAFVLRSLQKDREKRIPSATAFRQGLEDILKQLGIRAIGPGLGAYIRSLFPDEMIADREMLQLLNRLAQTRLLKALRPPPLPPSLDPENYATQILPVTPSRRPHRVPGIALATALVLAVLCVAGIKLSTPPGATFQDTVIALSKKLRPNKSVHVRMAASLPPVTQEKDK